MSCEHPDFHAEVDVNRLADIKRFSASVRIRCAKCGVQMRFLGLPRGVDLNGAATSIDACEANLAIHPKGEDVQDFKGVHGFTVKGPQL